MSKQVHFVVNLLIVKDSKVLLEREPGKHWKFPGGHIEPGETPIDTLHREAKEELGIEIELLDSNLLFDGGPKVHSIPNPVQSFREEVKKDSHLNDSHVNMGMVYMVTTTDNPKPMEGQEIKWFSLDELEEGDFFKAIKKLVEMGLKTS
ncbi:NUDIX domain-containing protein [Patescibacteria group bacterium]